MGEWAQCRSRIASSSHGWSAYGGQVYGAYYPEQDPSGSSSGSAVAVSVGLALGALGTEVSIMFRYLFALLSWSLCSSWSVFFLVYRLLHIVDFANMADIDRL